MSDRKWEEFFDLLSDIVNLDGLSFGEKTQLVKTKAEELGNQTDLEEFASWFQE